MSTTSPSFIGTDVALNCFNLKCPTCGDSWMHGNGEPFTVVPTYRDQPVSDGRLNWLAIPIRGESCEHRWLLKLHFYKGNAFIDAVPDTRPDSERA